MLVRLYALPSPAPSVAGLHDDGIVCRRAEPFERSAVTAFVRQHFAGWVDELLIAFSHTPVGVFIAARGRAVLGFACYNATRPDFFGPTGVAGPERGRGIGRALLLLALDALRAEGYAYAIIGGVGPAAFYELCVGATIIDGSDPGIFAARVSES